jgi:hypothetical protein
MVHLSCRMNSTVGTIDEITDILYRFELTEKGFRLFPIVNSYTTTELEGEGDIEENITTIHCQTLISSPDP